MTNKKTFYDLIRRSLFAGRIKPEQLEGIEAILDNAKDFGVNDLRRAAYVLATVYHETAKTMQPIEEYGKGKGKRYGQKIDVSGKPYNEPNHIYYGRGHVQVTWKSNYAKLTTANNKGWDFVNNPELLLQMIPSVFSVFYGMKNGIFTGKKLSDYINDKKTDFVGARRIINGTDKAELIAIYADKFYEALIVK